MKRVAAGAHLPTPLLFEPAKRPDDRGDYCLDCSFQWKLQFPVEALGTRFYTWSGARPMGEQCPNIAFGFHENMTNFVHK